MSDTLFLTRAEGDNRSATVTINRPPLNILDIPTIESLAATLDDLEKDPDLQVVVVRGGGDRAFSAGVAVQDHTPDKVGAMLSTLHGAIKKLRTLPAVTVAAVQGHCLGGGMEVALACDLVLATEDARFGQPEIELGCYPPVAAALYPSRIGPGRTLELLLTGRTLTCEQAEAMGLIARRVPKGSLDEETAKLVSEIAGRSAAVTRITKQAVRIGDRASEEAFFQALDDNERLYLDKLCPTADMAEGLAAFLEKRRPVWKHR
jgi:cyclohexa-1,5-dienecarbonyl-CoA hydratase